MEMAMTEAEPTPVQDDDFLDLPDFTPPPPTKKDRKGFRLYGEVFECRPRLSFEVIRKFTKALAKSSPDPKAPEGTQSLDEVINLMDWFFRKALKTQEGRDKFFKMRQDEELDIDIEVLMKIATHLAEAYSGDRPTGESSDSGSPTSSSTDGSKAGVRSAPLTYARSETPQLVTASLRPLQNTSTQ